MSSGRALLTEGAFSHDFTILFQAWLFLFLPKFLYLVIRSFFAQLSFVLCCVVLPSLPREGRSCTGYLLARRLRSTPRPHGLVYQTLSIRFTRDSFLCSSTRMKMA